MVPNGRPRAARADFSQIPVPRGPPTRALPPSSERHRLDPPVGEAGIHLMTRSPERSWTAVEPGEDGVVFTRALARHTRGGAAR